MSFDLNNFEQGKDGLYRKRKQKVVTNGKIGKRKTITKTFNKGRYVEVHTSAKKTMRIGIPDDIRIEFVQFKTIEYTTLINTNHSFQVAVFKIHNVKAIPAQRLNSQTVKLLHIDDDRLKPNQKSKKAAIQRYLDLKAYMKWTYEQCKVILAKSNRQFRPMPDYIKFHAGNEMPKSWSKKLRLEKGGQLRKRKPDWDNEAKAIQDGLFDEDEFVAIGTLEKSWQNSNFIILEMEVEKLQKE